MQDVFYDSNNKNKTALTREQQENVIKVVILAKELLLFMLKHISKKDLNMKHSFLNDSACFMFEQLFNNMSKTNNIIHITGNNYTIIERKDDNCFSIYKTKTNRLLIKSYFNNHKVKLVNGLTNEDVKKWEQIGKILQVDYRDSVKVNNSDAK